MNIKLYDSKVREVYDDLGFIIINQSYWYPKAKYTKEQAVAEFKKEMGIK